MQTVSEQQRPFAKMIFGHGHGWEVDTASNAGSMKFTENSCSAVFTLDNWQPPSGKKKC
jgi:hypothetical protein